MSTINISHWIGALILFLTAACGANVKFQGGGALDSSATHQFLFTQADRQAYSETFNQALIHAEKTDVFTQGQALGPLDLLVVVDNSQSMLEEQQNLASKINPLLSYIANSDWQISIVTTDIMDTCQRGFITKDMSNKEQLFANAINAGILGNGTELGIYKAIEGLEGECLAAPWVRPDSAVAVLFLTDEDNCSGPADTTNCLGTGMRDSGYLYDYLDSIRTPGTDARVYGILSHPSSPCATASNIGVEYTEVIDNTGGTWGSICDADYTQTLTAISQDLSTILQNRFSLESPPIEETVAIRVNGVDLPSNEFQVLNYSVLFLNPPANGANIEIYYESSELVEQSIFPLANPASVLGAKVFFGSEHLDEDLFYIDPKKQALILKEPPAVNTEIVVEYRENTELKSQFDLPKRLNPDSLRCAVNNEPSADFVYDADLGTITFTPAPLDAAQIVIEYED